LTALLETSATETAVAAAALTRTYGDGDSAVHALRGVSLTLPAGQFTAVMGPSGSGKSTLLHLIAAMDRPTSGNVRVLGADHGGLSDRQLAAWRNMYAGFVFQNFNLIPVLTAMENVELPLRLTKLNRKERLDHATTALRLVGLEDRLHHYPRQLSGGQEQRVAIARAIATDPDLILADEPTGNWMRRRPRTSSRCSSASTQSSKRRSSW
jgi:putative ABC transport system ATP-binding protein